MTLRRQEGVMKTAEKEVIAASPVQTIKISAIVPPKKHDRSQYDENAIDNLAENIKHQGLLQPIVVRKLDNGTYERIAGFRRLKAVQKLGHTEILARVINATDLQALKAMLSENTERENLNVYDQAVFFEEIILVAMSDLGEPLLSGMTARDLRRRLFRMRNRELGNVTEDFSDDEALFDVTMRDSILSQYGFGLSSFVKFMSILDFEEHIVEALKGGLIERATAAELNRMSKKCPDKIPEAIVRVVENKMGSREAGEMVSLYLKGAKSDNKDIAKGIGKIINIKSIPERHQRNAKTLIDTFIGDITALYDAN